MSMDGDILFENMFVCMPEELPGTGCFAVRNDSTKDIDIYTLECTPKLVASGYSQIGIYGDGLLPVVEKGGWVKYIDKQGNEKISLKEVDGQKVQMAGSFHEGRARFWINDKCGFIDKTGQVVVPAKFEYAESYREGTAVVFKGGECKEINIWSFEECSEISYNYESNDISTWSVIDKNGKILFTMADSICRYSWKCHKDLFEACGNNKKFYINKKGEITKIEDIEDFSSVLQNQADEGGTPIEKFVRKSNNREDVEMFYGVYSDYENRALRKQDSLFYLINEKGENLSKGFAEYSMRNGFYIQTANVLASEYVDIDELVANLTITDLSIDGFKIGMSEKEIEERFDSIKYDEKRKIWRQSHECSKVFALRETFGTKRWSVLGSPIFSRLYKFVFDDAAHDHCCGILQSYNIRTIEEQDELYNQLKQKLDGLFVQDNINEDNLGDKLESWFGNEYYCENGNSNISLKSYVSYKTKRQRQRYILLSGTENEIHHAVTTKNLFVQIYIYIPDKLYQWVKDNTIRMQDDLLSAPIGAF